MLQRVKRTSVGEAVIAEIRDAIARGDLKPGDQLPPERELAAKLGVSRLGMREGLKVLEAMGLVEARQGEGTFICRPTAENLMDPLVAKMLEPAQLLELIEARTVLEVELAGLAARRASAVHRDKMAGSLKVMEERLSTGGDFLPADIEFHDTMMEAAGNQILAHVYANILDLIDHLRMRTYTVPGSGQRALISHKQIFAAIDAHNEAAARTAMRDHMKNVAKDLEQVMKQGVLKERE
ncbi:MAG TPA: FadR/GntR family transcriptional regulator [Symbiobacteriaceae bacterium]